MKSEKYIKDLQDILDTASAHIPQQDSNRKTLRLQAEEVMFNIDKLMDKENLYGETYCDFNEVDNQIQEFKINCYKVMLPYLN